MIRSLGEGDREVALRFLDRDHECNLIMIYDLDHFGLENRGHPFQGDYYGSFGPEGLNGVAVLFNFGSLFIYAPDAEAAPRLVEHMASLERKPSYVIGRAEWAGPVIDRLEEQGLHPTGAEDQDYLVLTRGSFRPRSGHETRFAEPSDLERLIELNRAFQIEYFGGLTDAEEELGRMAEVRMERAGIAVAVADGEIVSKAESMVRTERAALIGGVYTVPAYRGRGLSAACMSRLCGEILGSIGKACLNVSTRNTPARRVYRGLGFERSCDYRMAHYA
ncbi:MAG: GNAT family N-acetyltransferase [Actinomycetota bacterium]